MTVEVVICWDERQEGRNKLSDAVGKTDQKATDSLSRSQERNAATLIHRTLKEKYCPLPVYCTS